MRRRPAKDPDGIRQQHNGYVDDPDRQCVGKTKYPKKATAKKALTRMSGFPKRRSRLKPYLCPHCGYYHLGEKVPGRRPPPLPDLDSRARA